MFKPLSFVLFAIWKYTESPMRSLNTYFLPILLVILLNTPALAQTVGVNPPDAVPFFGNKTVVKVCVSDWTPAVYCKNKTDTADYTGFEVELFRKVMPYLGWIDTMVEMKCLEWDEMMNDLYSDNGDCDIAPAGMQPRADRIEKGLRFSVSSLRTGFSIMVARSEEAPGIWYIFSAMSPAVWAAMVITGAVIGVIVWLFEVGMRALNHDTRYMAQVWWDTVGRPVQMRDYRLSSFPANLTALLWSFLVFILMVLYSANLTSNLTVSIIKSDIRGLADLPGKAVATWDGYVPILAEYNIAAKPYPWNGAADEQIMINDLKSGFVRAVVLDDSTLQILDATDCDTMLVGNQFNGFEQCVGFPQSTWQGHPDFVEAYNQAVYKVIEDRGVEELTNRFITIPQAPCKTSTVSEGYSTVTFQQVGGLWVILACSVVVGVLCVVCYRAWGPGKHKIQHSRWFKWMCPCFVEPARQKFSKSMTQLVNSGLKKDNYNVRMSNVDDSLRSADGTAMNTTTTTPITTTSNMDRDDPMWEYRYNGASLGYVDGSHDAQRAEVMSQGHRPRRAASMVRSDTARAARGGSSSVTVTDTASFQALVIAELAALRAQIDNNNNNTSNLNLHSGGDGPLRSISELRSHNTVLPPQQQQNGDDQV